MSDNNATHRFSKTVEDYVRYRPSYPAQVPQLLNEGRVDNGKTVADIGCGTGLFTKLLLEDGYRVIGVEPNPDMLRAARELLAGYENFESKNGRAEATDLEDNSVDFITIAQAFHWVDPLGTKKEFQRILKPGGTCLLVWNLRINETPLMQAYEDILLEYGTDYKKVAAENIIEEDIRAFFAPNEMKIARFRHAQAFNYEGLRGRLLSTSYSPKKGEQGFEKMMIALKNAFDHNQKDGLVNFEYECKCYYGQLGEDLETQRK